jgi:hypothetical protein
MIQLIRSTLNRWMLYWLTGVATGAMGTAGVIALIR